MKFKSKKQITIKIFVVFLLGIFLMSLAGFGSYDENVARQNFESLPPSATKQLILDTLGRQNVSGAAAAIISGYSVTTYMVSLTTNIDSKITEDSFFYIASLSKAFTALGVQLLEYFGYINFDDSITKYFPNLFFRYRDNDFDSSEITIHNLLFHTSGLDNVRHSGRIDPSNEYNALEVAVNSLNNTRLLFRPGSKYNYASVNYIILGRIIEIVSGMSFTNFMHQNIFTQLNLFETTTCRYVASQLGVVVQGRRPSWFLSRPNEITASKTHTPTGFMLSTLSDLVRWTQLQLNPENAPYPLDILIKNQHTPDMSVVPHNAYFHYGYGWHINPSSGRIRHPGAGPNVVSEILIYRETSAAVVVWMNCSGGRAINLAENLLAISRNEPVGEIVRGSTTKMLDTLFSSLSIVFIIITTVLIALNTLVIFSKIKDDRKLVSPSKKSVIIIGLLALIIIILAFLVTFAPSILSLPSWYVLTNIWAPLSLVTLLIFICTSLFFTAILITIKLLFRKKGNN